MPLLISTFLAFALLFSGAVWADETESLPSDFFIPQLGKLEETIEIKQTPEREFQIRQHLGGRPFPRDSWTLLNFMTFCVAYGLSTRRGYSGWSMTMGKPSSDTPIERFLTVRLANSADDLKDVASPKDWTGYIDNARIRDNTCNKMVSPQYIK